MAVTTTEATIMTGEGDSHW